MTALNNDKIEEISIQATMKEVADLESAMRDFMSGADKGVGAAGALIITALTLALTKSQMALLIALPYALTAVFFFMLQKYVEREVCAGIRRFLEECLNKRIGQDVFKRMEVARNLERRDEGAALGVYAAAGVGVLLLSGWALSIYAPLDWSHLSRNIGWWMLHLFGIAVCGCAVYVVIDLMNNAEKRAYEKAKEADVSLRII
ncbi:hypothetical protein [Streptomyces sp. NBC_00038]|uniref:hypothetical protein n=1 Tax=Streptomyces sp. NBC_00038 TaxID=2903615 RepID=UPI002256E96B|nr:hypothetical protein [Streptomyces sp. NBC_00038]MCX5561940.1 hypothetical protein [Streptomyces sp. NBC_00038]